MFDKPRDPLAKRRNRRTRPGEHSRRLRGKRRNRISAAGHERDRAITVARTDKADWAFQTRRIDLSQFEMTDLHQREEIGRFTLLPEQVARLELTRAGGRQELALFVLGKT
jgi:hypothetical protein